MQILTVLFRSVLKTHTDTHTHTWTSNVKVSEALDADFVFYELQIIQARLEIF